MEWGRAVLVAPDGRQQVVWDDQPKSLAKTVIRVAGLAAGTKVKVLFEDREIVAQQGSFTDDFRGQDLYQRYGTYGNAPVALHIYDIPR